MPTRSPSVSSMLSASQRWVTRSKPACASASGTSPAKWVPEILVITLVGNCSVRMR